MPRLLSFLILLSLLGSPSGAVEWAHQPASDAQVKVFQPEISLTWPLGSALPYKQARMFVDNLEVTGDCLKTGMFISYQPSTPMRRGRHEVRVEIGGNQQTWSFEVVGVPLLKNALFSARVPVKAFDKVEVEAIGEGQGKAWAEIVGFPEHYALKEHRRGIYRDQFKLPAKIAGKPCQIEVFLEKNGQLDRMVCDGSIAMAAPDLKVEWLSPNPGATVEANVRVRGKTLPDYHVDIAVKAFFRDGVEFGKLPPEMRRSLQADSEGFFELDYTFPSGFPRLGVHFQAVARDDSDNLSPPANLLLFLGRKTALPPLRTDLPPTPP